MVVGVHVQLPEQLFTPRRQRLEADRLDVDPRQQAEHLQPLLDANQVGKTADDRRVLGVAAERDDGHLQVLFDEKSDDRP